MTRLSLRWIVLLPVLLTMTLGIAMFGAYLDRVEYRNRIADIDAELVRARSSAQQPGPGPAGGAGTGGGGGAGGAADNVADQGDDELVTPPVHFIIRDGGDVVGNEDTSPFDEQALRELSALDGFHTFDDVRSRVLITPLPNGDTAVTGLSLDGIDAAVSDFRRALATGGIVIVLIQALVVWLLASRLIAPVRKMTRVATRVADGELDTEVPAPSGSSEIATLATDLDRMLTRLRSTISSSEQSTAEAQRARDDMQRFVADVSHEFRTPLTALRGYSDLYERGMLDEPGALDRAMGRIGSESDRLHSMVSDMLELTRSGDADREISEFNVAEVVSDVVADLGAAYPDHHITGLGLDAESVLSGQRDHVHQAILNLGANACQYGGDSAVEIELSSADDVSISVIDHGPGIDIDLRQRVLLPFVRGDASRNRSGGSGAGLGLAVTNQIAERYGGTLVITETEGGGATFTLTFPR